MGQLTSGEIERLIVKASEEIGVSFINGAKLGECLQLLQECHPKIHSTEYLRQLAKENLEKMENEFSYKGLRIWYWDHSQGGLLQSFTGPDDLQVKYEKLIGDMKLYHGGLMYKLSHNIDYVVYNREIMKYYREKYGSLNYAQGRLYSIIKTIHISYYDEAIVNALHDTLVDELRMSGDLYYVTKDLHNEYWLKMLWEHVADENFDESVYKGFRLFYGFDGYGNTYFVDDYTTYWSDDEGYHCRMSSPDSSIEDFVKIQEEE